MDLVARSNLHSFLNESSSSSAIQSHFSRNTDFGRDKAEKTQIALLFSLYKFIKMPAIAPITGMLRKHVRRSLRHRATLFH